MKLTGNIAKILAIFNSLCPLTFSIFITASMLLIFKNKQTIAEIKCNIYRIEINDKNDIGKNHTHCFHFFSELRGKKVYSN
jgi:hypothetical protein